MAENKKYKVPDPYRVNPDMALDILSNLQDTLWYDSSGNLKPDKEWDSDTLEQLVAALSPLAPVEINLDPEPKRITWVTLQVMTRAALAPLSVKDLAGVVTMLAVEADGGPRTDAFAATLSMHDEVVSGDVARQRLAQYGGYAPDHFEERDED